MKNPAWASQIALGLWRFQSACMWLASIVFRGCDQREVTWLSGYLFCFSLIQKKLAVTFLPSHWLQNSERWQCELVAFELGAHCVLLITSHLFSPSLIYLWSICWTGSKVQSHESERYSAASDDILGFTTDVPNLRLKLNKEWSLTQLSRIICSAVAGGMDWCIWSWLGNVTWSLSHNWAGELSTWQLNWTSVCLSSVFEIEVVFFFCFIFWRFLVLLTTVLFNYWNMVLSVYISLYR